MLTESMGRVVFFVPVPKSAKAKLKRQYFLPLTLLDVEFDYRQTVNMQRLKEVSIATPLADLALSPYKTTIAMFLAEFLTYATRGEQENTALFLFVWNSILWLEKASGHFANFHLVFMLKLPIFLGFSPNLDASNGFFFDLQEGMFVRDIPMHTDFLDIEESTQLLTLMRLQYTTMHLFRLSRKERNRCVEIALSYYQFHIPNFPTLKSFPVLQEVLS